MLKTQETIITMKDNILHEINLASENASLTHKGDSLFEIAEKLLIVFQFTKGFWVEENYCYKAREIMDKLAKELNQFACERILEGGLHHKTQSKIDDCIIRILQMRLNYSVNQ